MNRQFRICVYGEISGDTADESMVDERDGEEEAEALAVGQYVHHALVESEHKANSRKVVKIFKRNNADWHKIRVIMTDKAVHEKYVMCEMFPQATQLLCQWHVVTWLKSKPYGWRNR
ncbi:MULE transposase domain [Phytophthora cactorum]|nr:MULE transposase domain [Phytophthora cactorum]